MRNAASIGFTISNDGEEDIDISISIDSDLPPLVLVNALAVAAHNAISATTARAAESRVTMGEIFQNTQGKT